MNIDRMRLIDRWAGIPLCALVSLALRLQAWLKPPSSAAAARNILFVEMSEMGSTILADGALRKARDQLGAVLHFAIFQRNAGSLAFTGTVPPENVFTVRESSLVVLALDTVRLLLWCRRRRIDTVIDLELFSRYTALITGLSGAANRVGFHRFHGEGLYRGEMLTRRVPYNPHHHVAKNFVALVDSLSEDPDTLPHGKRMVSDGEIAVTRRPADPTELDVAAARLRAAYPEYDRQRHRLVLLNANASDLLPHRRWMPERFAAVGIELCRRYPDVVVVLTGSSAERPAVEQLRAMIGAERCVNFAGCLKLGELPALYHLAAAMVTNDSGPGHFAAVTAMPTIVLFGPETPALYGPLGNTRALFAGLSCSPCVSAANHRKTPCTDPVCMAAITVDDVMVELDAVLSSPGA